MSKNPHHLGHDKLHSVGEGSYRLEFSCVFMAFFCLMGAPPYHVVSLGMLQTSTALAWWRVGGAN
jgi:hypothetical protein